MLKQSYDSQESIPENLRGAYVQSGGKWVLDELTSEHPVVQKRDELLRENSSQKGQITRLTNEKTALEGQSLPSGHVAVPAVDAQLVNDIRALGKPVADLKTIVSEHATLKQEGEQRARQDGLKAAAKAAGYDPEVFSRLSDLPEVLTKDVDDGKGGKVEQAFAKVKTGTDTFTEKPLTEFIEGSDAHKVFLPALKAESKGGTRVHGTSTTTSTPAKDVFTRAREAVKDKQKQREDVHPMFNQIPGRAQAQAGE